MQRNGVWIAAAALALAACAPKVDPMSAPITPQDRIKVQIPQACEVAYNNALPTVAVVDFANNTSFDMAAAVEHAAQGTSTTTSTGASVSGVGIGASPAGIGVVGAEAHAERTTTNFAERSQTIQRQINAKLGASVAEGVQSKLVEMGGMKLFTRRQLKQVLEEQKFQMSGLVDPKTAVRIGKLVGVRYIITGAVNNALVKYVPPSEDNSSGGGLLGMLASAAAKALEGWNVEVDIVLNVIDVQTGEMVFSKEASGFANLGNTPSFSYDLLIGGIKKAAKRAVDDLQQELAQYFPLRGYIIQLRTPEGGEKRFALINLGRMQKVQPGQKFAVIDFQEVEDPITGKRTCDQVKLPVTLTISNQVQADKAWGVVEGDGLSRVKLGQVVERTDITGAIF